MPVEIWLYGLLGLMILASIVTLEMKDVLSSIVAVGIVGLILSMSFLILQAPDLALVQFVFEILSVIILIMAFARKESHASDLRIQPGAVILAGAILLPILLLGLGALKGLPPFGEPLLKVSSRYLEQGARETGAANIVTAIILDYRAYDTLGEATVIFTGILGAIAIIRKIGRKQA